MIKKLLIANRGEIAVRIIRAAHELNVRTVAVYSEADKSAIHTALADEAVNIGEPEPQNSYLSIPKILAAAEETGADAIHPGYGFLSERAEFAEACEEKGIVFVGPKASAMRQLGSKIEAKELAVKAGVPITPGFFQRDADARQLADAALDIGYPVMLKASAGGGGRGMRVVRDPVDFDSEMALASEEALKAFGDGAMMVEKLVDRPRHVEVQVLADHHGNVACLFERECSIQRRHQKLIEESPAVVGASIWTKMKEAVEKLIQATGYTNAGTVEFIFDEPANKFYFLEVNARLQVEHPVTEMITGLDLVQWQLMVASGEEIPMGDPAFSGARTAIRGHAIEARVVAEDPARGFLPSVGKIQAWAEPHAPGVRVDTGYGPGAEISRYYDSLIAKVIVHAGSREGAIDRLIDALEDFHILGVKTNLAYLIAILKNGGFRAGDFDTGTLGRDFADWHPSDAFPVELASILNGVPVASSSRAGDTEPLATAWQSDAFRNA